MPDSSEPLVELLDEDLPKLRDIYKNTRIPLTQYVLNVINLLIQWKSKCPDRNSVIAYAIRDEWEKYGSFFILMKYGCYDLFMFTLKDDYDSMHCALVRTKNIDWKSMQVIYGLDSKYHTTILNTLAEVKCTVYNSVSCYLMRISIDTGKKFVVTCPPEINIARLKPNDASIINELWPHSSENSENYIRTMIEVNGGYGVYLKSNNELAAWVLKNPIGALGLLQTVDKHRRKGYATLVTKVLAKELAEEGFEPMGTVLVNNRASQEMFTKLGFNIVTEVIFIESIKKKICTFH